ncbi:COG1470 family protein [Micromonosporaceae bacterium Da 78-11]
MVGVTLPLRVTVAPERADAAPGDNLQFDVTVRNASDIVEHYGVELLGLPDGATVRAEPDVAKLRPAESGTLSVRVTLPVQPPAPAGTYVVGALVRSRYRHDVSRCVEVPVELASVEQITVRTTPEVVNGGRGGQFMVEVANGGNAPVRLHLSATDPERRVTTVFQPPWVDLPPGASAQATLTVAAQLPWNREMQRRLTVTAAPDQPGAPAGTSIATFVQKPRFASKFTKVAGIAAAVVVLAAAIAVPTLLAQGKDPAPAPITPTAVAQPQPGAAAPPPVAVTSAAPPAATSAAAPSAPAPAATSAAVLPGTDASSAPAPTTGAAREVDLTTPPDGVIASDAFRDQGFLVSGDPGTVAVPGCEAARSAAVVTDLDGKRFLTSSAPDDPTKCHEVPLMIDFLPETPAGAVTLTPLTPGTLGLEVVYRDLSRQTLPEPTVLAALAKAHGGIDFLLVRPASADGAATPPVALTAISVAPLT